MGANCNPKIVPLFMVMMSLTHRTRPFPAGGKSQAAQRSRRGGGEGKRRSHSAAEAAAGVRGGAVAELRRRRVDTTKIPSSLRPCILYTRFAHLLLAATSLDEVISFSDIVGLIVTYNE